MSLDKKLENLILNAMKEATSSLEEKIDHLHVTFTKKELLTSQRSINAREASSMLGVSRSHFNQAIKFRSDFPKPINKSGHPPARIITKLINGDSLNNKRSSIQYKKAWVSMLFILNNYHFF